MPPTFFSVKIAPGGKSYHSVARIILRGNDDGLQSGDWLEFRRRCETSCLLIGAFGPRKNSGRREEKAGFSTLYPVCP
jgi:hypothetical protein